MHPSRWLIVPFVATLLAAHAATPAAPRTKIVFLGETANVPFAIRSETDSEKYPALKTLRDLRDAFEFIGANVPNVELLPLPAELGASQTTGSVG